MQAPRAGPAGSRTSAGGSVQRARAPAPARPPWQSTPSPHAGGSRPEQAPPQAVDMPPRENRQEQAMDRERQAQVFRDRERQAWGREQEVAGRGQTPAGNRYRGDRPAPAGRRDRDERAGSRDRSRDEQAGSWDRYQGTADRSEGRREETPRPPLRQPGYTKPGTALAAPFALTARLVAVQQLLRIEQEGAYAGLVSGSPSGNGRGEDDMEEELDESASERQGSTGPSGAIGEGGQGRIRVDLQEVSAGLSSAEQCTLRNLVSGVTRWRRRLDYIVSCLAGRSAAELEPSMRQVLRLAIFELTHMNLAPHAIGQFVDLARHLAGHEAAPRFANGVLRSAVRALEADNFPAPENELRGRDLMGRDLLRCLAIQYSHPTWLAARWLRRFGTEGAEALMEHNNRHPTYTARINSLTGTTLQNLADDLAADGVEVAPAPLLPGEFLEIRGGLQTLLKKRYVLLGMCNIQDVAQGLVVRLALNPQPGERLLDCCAAPGGKTVYAAAHMQGKGSITAVDISAAKVNAITRLAACCRVPKDMLRVVAADFREWAAKEAAPGIQHKGWDRILLDVPCSGSGVLAKRADLRWRKSAQDLEELVKLQAQLLDAAAPLVRAEGGVLVYSTCSIEPEEGEGQVEAFLSRHPEFQLQPLTAQDARAAGAAESVVTPEGFLFTLPHVHGVDGAFAARLVRHKQ